MKISTLKHTMIDNVNVKYHDIIFYNNNGPYMLFEVAYGIAHYSKDIFAVHYT